MQRSYIIFIDPKGTEHITNPVDKIIGFKEFKEQLENANHNFKISTSLFYFNEQSPEYIDKEYQKYWKSDLSEIF